MKLLMALLFLLPCGAFATSADEFLHERKNVPVIREGPAWVSEWMEVELPVGLRSFSIGLTAEDDVFIQVADLISPDGTLLVRSGPGRPPRISPYVDPVLQNVVSLNRSEAVVPGTGSLNVPNTPSLPAPAPGVWKMRALLRAEPADKKISLSIRGVFSPPSPLMPVLRLRIWLSPESPWTEHREEVAFMLAETERVFAEAGLRTEIRSFDVLATAPSGPMELPQDMTAIARELNQPDAVNVYLMPEMQYQNKPVNGLACLGGPVVLPKRHGCFVSMYADHRSAQVSPAQKAKILIHEIGHYLGLFHTKDEYFRIGVVFDPIADTPEEVTGHNLMDPGIHNTAPVFTPQQKAQLLKSPALF